MKKKQLKSFYPKKDSLKESWILYDANEKVLGRAASEISSIVLGKTSPTYTPGVFNQQYVVVINAEKIKVTGKKLTDKKYYRHSGYPGGLKETSLEALMDKKPTEALRKAVNGMLPHNSHGRNLQRKVFYYAGEAHEQQAQQPVKYGKG
tara:strand:+ start:292 stop:738 length:447 start_codon:yes stop_codon:yes gene_type:complete